MSIRRRLLQVLSIVVVLSMLFSGFSVPAASAQGNDGIQHQRNAQTGKVTFLSPESGRVLSAAKALGISAVARPTDPGMALAKRFGPEFGLQNPERDLTELKTNQSENGRVSIRYQQNYQGIPVMGGELIVNTNRNADLYSMNGEISVDLSLPTQPTIDPEQARQTALQSVAKWYEKAPEDFLASKPELWIFDESLLQPSTRPAELVWRMEVTPKDNSLPIRELVLVNAERGHISMHFNQVDTVWTDLKNAAHSLHAQTTLSAAPSIVKYEDLVADEARNRLYGVDKVGDKIDVISMVDLTVIRSYMLVYGAAPVSVDLSPDGNELAVAQSGSGLVKFINLINNSMSETSAILTGSGSRATDVIYGRPGVLYALSGNGIHVINLTVTPHQENPTQYMASEGYPYSEKFGEISSDRNTLYFVTGTCCSGYNSLNKYNVSSGLAKPVLLKQTHLYGTGYMKGIRISLIDDQTLLITTGSVYNTSDLTPKAKNFQRLFPAINLPGRDFYTTLYNNEGLLTDLLYFYDNETSHRLSSLDTGVLGTLGAITTTSNGNTIFVSSTGGMAKFSVGDTPPGTPIALPSSQHQYNDLAIDIQRQVVYGTDISGRIDVIDMDTAGLVSSYLLPAGADPMGIDLSPDGSELAVALHGLEKILFIDPEDGATIAQVTPQLDDSIYYDNFPFDLIYGRTGRLYSSGNPGSGGIDYIHVIDTATHTWITKSPYPNTIRTDTEFILDQSKTYLYANQTFSPNNLYIYDVRSDVVTKLYQGPHGPVYAQNFTIVPDGSKIFTSNGQVWDSILQSQLGTLQGAPGKLIKYVPSPNIIALSAGGTNGDVVKFIDPADHRLIATYTPSPAGAIHEMEVAPDGSKLIINFNGEIRVLDLDPSRATSITVLSGSNQSTMPLTPFSSPLKAKVQNYLGQPISGITVTFTAPASGASGTFANTHTTISTAVTDASGIATSSTFSANNISGGYIVAATIVGLGAPANFELFNGTQRVKTYTANNAVSLPGTFLCEQTQPHCTNNANPHADAAHKYAIGTHSLYSTQHQRNSIDNNNMLVISTVHFASGYANAFWSGSQMVYGDAYGYPLADDVVAHEFTHGVTQYESNLFYYYQSGAINESFSDLWGEYYDQTNGLGTDTANSKWQIGEDVSGLGALRSMSDPPSFSHPDRMSSGYYYLGEEDDGGVHTNSGINNKAVYLMVDGGSFNYKYVTAMGWEKTAAIYYEANTNLLTSGADYSDLYFALQQACSNLIGQKGITSGDCLEVKDAIDAVEMNYHFGGFDNNAPYCDQGDSDPITIFSDGFESGTGNWVFTNGAYTRWQLDSPYGAFARSGNHSLYADDYPAVITDAHAKLKSLVVPSHAYLRFAHAYDFETDSSGFLPEYYDGGVLEYSINGGSTWSDAMNLIDYNGYDGLISTGTGNPLSDRLGFVGTSRGYISARVNLASLAGKSVTFRWRMGLDEAVAAWGWWVDDVSVYQCMPGPVGPGVYDDANASIWTYNGSWGTWSGAGPYASTIHYSNTTGATATFPFKAPAKFILTYTADSNRGNMLISVDGGTPVSINAYSPSVNWLQTYTSPIYTDTGSHTITISTPGNGKYIDIDALQIVTPLDMVAPAPITNLTATTGTTTGSVNLSWTAVGDDGTSGTASSYAVRYSTAAINSEITWANATAVTGGLPTPKAAGQVESMTVSGLVPGQTYSFAVRAKDEEPNLGGLSNSPSATAQTPPPAGAGTYDDAHSSWTYSGSWSTWSGSGPYATTMHYSNATGAVASFTFQAPAKFILTYSANSNRGEILVSVDGGAPVAINSYSAAVKWQQSYTSAMYSDNGSHTVTVSTPGNSKYIDIDAIRIVTPLDLLAPAAIADLTATSGTATGSVNLSWTAVGDDGTSGTASSYAVRYSTSAINNEAAWANSTPVTTGLPAPKAAGQAENMTVSGLVPGQTYYFAIRAEDEEPNLSGLSNSPSAFAKTPPPASAGTYDDAHVNWTYSGSWSTWSGTGPYATTMHYSNATGAAASFTFQAPAKFVLTYSANSNRGDILASVDGGAPVAINSYSAAVKWQQSYTSAMYSDTGTHTVTISTPGNGKYIDIDAIQIIAPPTPQGPGTYDDAHAAWTYNGSWGTWSGSGPQANTIHYSNATGATAAFTFQAPAKFILLYTVDSNRGNLLVSVDGGAPVSINAYGATTRWQQTYTSTMYSDTGSHTVTISTPGNSKYIDVDAIRIVTPLDLVAPAAITSLGAMNGPMVGSVYLSWNSVGDDGMSGTAGSYEVRYSTTSIGTETDWANAMEVTTGIPTPKPAGQAEIMTISGLVPGQNYYFAVRAKDEESNLGGLSDSPVATATAPAPAEAGTYDDSHVNWTYIGNWGTWNGTGPSSNTMHYTNAAGATANFIFRAPAKFILTYSANSNRGDLLISVDGGEPVRINAYSSTVKWQQTYTSALYSDTSIHTVTISTPGNGKYIDVDAIQIVAPPTPQGPGTYDDTHAAWTYNGSWGIWNGAGPSGNTIHYSNTTGATATFIFQAPAQFILTYSENSNRGDILVSVDGGTPVTINAYSPTVQWLQTYMSDVYSDTDSHTVTISTPGGGTYIDVDAIQIVP